MLTLVNTPSNLDSLDDGIEFTIASKTLANGNTLTVYGVVDFSAFGGEGGFTTRAVQTDANGQPVAGSGFDVFPLQSFDDADNFSAEGIAQFGDGSVGIFGEGALDTGTLIYRQFSIDPSTQAASFVQQVDFTYDYAASGGLQADPFNNAEVLTLRENADGSVTALVGYEALTNAPANGGYVPHVVELDFSSTGTAQDTANTGTEIFDETWNGWVALSDGSYVAMDQFDPPIAGTEGYIAGVQVKFISGQAGTQSANVQSNNFLFHGPLGEFAYLSSANLVEIGDGRIAAVWTWVDRFADETETVRTYTAIVDPALQGSGTNPVVTQPVLLQQSVGSDEWDPQIAALPDGTYVVVFSEAATDPNLPAVRSYVQHLDTNAVPLGPRMDIGASLGELGFALSVLPSGQVQISTSTEDGADFDVQAEVYNVSAATPGVINQVAAGNAGELFETVVLEGDLTSVTPTQINLVGSDPTKTGIVTGTGFIVDSTGYINDIVDGTVNSLQLFDNGVLILEWSGLQMPIHAIGSAIVQSETGATYIDRLIDVFVGDYSGATSTGPIDGGSPFYNTTGSTFDDTLEGGDGNNNIDGGTGADAMTGGAGDDYYVVENVGDTVTELAGEGSDIIDTFVSYDVPVNVEVLRMQGTADLGTNGSVNRDIIQGNSGNNYINGAGGLDLMVGGSGNDTYTIDDSQDAVIEAAGGGDDVIYTSVDYVLLGDQEIETAILTENAVILRGDNSDNQLIGNDFINVLEGKGGTDYLLGLGGDDIFQVSLEANATDLDVFGDFEGAGVVGGDRIALDAAIWGMDGIVYQVSQTSFIVATAQNTMQQQFQIANITAPTTNLIAGDDYYFG
ncbi:calcium-binding protein [Ahrensia sp. R2A130]|uniref:calcium-binding protein n=1 Tax=Ahrensia sp. R2A130 TaxID=744979 RepID=UPI0001E0ACE0|nr:calcium-binding protein [Ahrensia sp. R2A130]EFL88465.1 calcium-binding protein, hemolysin-type [Ahrensia sp. R2A130]